MTLANWRDLSLILLVIQAFILTLIPGVILFFSIRGVSWILRKVRETGPKARRFFGAVESRTQLVSEKVATPFIAVGASAAQAQRWRRAATSFRSRSAM